MLVDCVLESPNSGLLESVLMPFDIYNDSAQQALVLLKQRFLYDEIEAEVLHTLNLVLDDCMVNFTKQYNVWFGRK